VELPWNIDLRFLVVLTTMLAALLARCNPLLLMASVHRSCAEHFSVDRLNDVTRLIGSDNGPNIQSLFA
jgi:hypothetical protein